MADETVMKKGQQEAKRQNSVITVLKRLSCNKGAVIGGIIFLLMILAAVFAPLLAPYDYAAINVKERLMSPCAAHLFGTDQMGRDIFSRILYGARYSLAIGIGAVVFSSFFGIVFGAIAGYYGGKIDNLLMRLCDIVQSVPGLILNIALAFALGPGAFNTVLALGVESIAGAARLMRSSILNVRKMEYLEAATMGNCSDFRIISKHVLPNTFAPMLVQATMGVGAKIMMAASMSYIGIGVQPPTPEWGAMLSDSRNFMMEYPYMCLIPGICIMIVVLSLNLLGDGLRDALDPKLKK